MTSSANAPFFTEESLTSLSTRQGEPQWLRDRRVAALRAFDAMAMPDPRAEEWRRTDISGLDLDIAFAQPGDPVTTWQAGGESPETFALQQTLSDSFYFGDLAEGLKLRGDAVQPHLHSLVLASEWKLAALQAAAWQQGTLIYVPRGLQVDIPLEVIVRGEGGPVFPHLLIIAEQNSGVTIIHDLSSVDGDLQSLASGAVEIFAAQDSRVRYIERQSWGNSTYGFETVRAKIERGADVSATLIGLGGRLARTKLEVDLVGEGARAELLGLSLGNEKQHFDYQTLQNHLAPHTASDLLFKAALDGQSSNVWYGTVRIHKSASQSEASQSSRNLLLSDHAKAAPIPVLEIEAYDVLRCSHGATAGPVDPEQLFYLESRGVPPAEAEALLIEAFFHEVVDRIPGDALREAVMEDITSKIGAVN
jgi:Fe-S cluster assembly protein SufD